MNQYSEEQLEKMRKLMIGATVIGVEDAHKDEALCCFRMTKNGQEHSFVLYATDLGFWVGNEMIGAKDKTYASVESMLQSIYDHSCKGNGDKLMFCDELPAFYGCADDVSKLTVGFVCFECGEEFTVKLSTLKMCPDLAKYFSTAEGRRKIAESLPIYLPPDFTTDDGKEMLGRIQEAWTIK